MAKIDEDGIELSESDRKRLQRRERDQRLATEKVVREGKSVIHKLNEPGRLEKDRDIENKLKENGRKPRELSYSFAKNEKVTLGENGEITRKSGFFRKKKQVQILDADSGKLRTVRYSERNRVTKSKKSLEFGENGKLIAEAASSSSGRFKEEWKEVDGKLVRENYFNDRFRDRGLKSAQHETWATVDTAGGSSRQLSRTVGFDKTIYDLGSDGKLKVVYRNSPTELKEVWKQEDGKTEEVKSRRFGLSSVTFKHLLDKEGNVIGRENKSTRRFLSKRSAEHDTQTGEETKQKHRVAGGVYSSSTEKSGQTEYKVRRLFGIRIGDGETKQLTDDMITAQRRRAESFANHQNIWRSSSEEHQAIQPEVMDPTDVRSIAESEIKSDVLDHSEGARDGDERHETSSTARTEEWVIAQSDVMPRRGGSVSGRHSEIRDGDDDKKSVSSFASSDYSGYQDYSPFDSRESEAAMPTKKFSNPFDDAARRRGFGARSNSTVRG